MLCWDICVKAVSGKSSSEGDVTSWAAGFSGVELSCSKLLEAMLGLQPVCASNS
jgi:hypothetical protein